MERYTNTILNKQGKPVAGAVVTVTTYPGNEPATIYAADGGQSVKSVTSDQNGRFAFYAADGHYNLSISGKHIDPFTITDIVLNDPSDDLSLGALQPVKDDLDALQLPDYAALRAYKGPRKSVYVTGAGIAGMFVRDDADTTTADNGGTVIVASGKRFKRNFDGHLYAEWFGVVGGADDETAKLQAAVSAAAGAVVAVQAGKTVKVADTIAVPKGTWIHLRGSIINASASHFNLFNFIGGGGIIGGKLKGAGNSTANVAGIAVRCEGVSNAPAAPTYVQMPTLIDVHIDGWGFYGVYGRFVQDGFINGGCVIENCGYAGAMFVSATNIHALRGYQVKNIGPGSSGNAYGIAFTRFVTADAVGNTTASPRSKNCSAIGGLVDGVPLWEGLDTHAGENIHFDDNTIRNCKVGIAIVSSHLGGNDDLAPQRCAVRGNNIAVAGGAAISVVGATAGAAVVEYVDDCIVAGNKIHGGGIPGNSIQGAILLSVTRRLRVTENAVREPIAFGICLYIENLDFYVGGNSITDPYDDTVTIPSCIGVRGNNNTGVIAPNILTRRNTALGTNVAKYGIYFTSGTTGNEIAVAKQALNGFSGISVFLPAALTTVDCSGIATRSGSASITVASGAVSAFVDVTFAKEMPMNVSSVSADITSAITVAGKAAVLRITNKSTTGFRVIAYPYDGTTFSAAGTITFGWSATT